MQIGYPRALWHLAIVKELIDNSLGHGEEIGVLPEIAVEVDDDGIAVRDNSADIAPDTVVGMLEFGKRVSSREAYRSLTRGAQGNAGKCLVGVPYGWNGCNASWRNTKRLDFYFSLGNTRHWIRILHCDSRDLGIRIDGIGRQ